MSVPAPMPSSPARTRFSSNISRAIEATGAVQATLEGQHHLNHGRDAEAVKRIVRVANPHGLHMRVCSAVARAAGDYPATVTVQNGDRVADAASILDLMSLGAGFGEEIIVSATGPRSHEVIELLVELLGQQQRLAG
jgi:phosphocarrier protein HPr